MSSSAILAKKEIASHPPLEKGIEKTLFPENWTLYDVLTKAQEALRNISEITELKRGRYRPQGKTNCGITIQFVFDSTGNIVSFFPIIEKVTP